MIDISSQIMFLIITVRSLFISNFLFKVKYLLSIKISFPFQIASKTKGKTIIQLRVDPLQLEQLSWMSRFVKLISCFVIFALSILNEIEWNNLFSYLVTISLIEYHFGYFQYWAANIHARNKIDIKVLNMNKCHVSASHRESHTVWGLILSEFSFVCNQC